MKRNVFLTIVLLIVFSNQSFAQHGYTSDEINLRCKGVLGAVSIDLTNNNHSNVRRTCTVPAPPNLYGEHVNYYIEGPGMPRIENNYSGNIITISYSPLHIFLNLPIEEQMIENRVGAEEWDLWVGLYGPVPPVYNYGFNYEYYYTIPLYILK